MVAESEGGIMSIEIIHPESEAAWLELRKKDVTSTEVAALFGISPYMTAYELWHRKHDNLDLEFEPSERMRWGNRLQDAIAKGIALDNKWHMIRRMDEYIRDTDLRMGASFDYEASVCDGTEPGHVCMDSFILEIKNVDSLAFNDGWIVNGENVEAPPHIELQVQQQLALSGFKTAYIGALIGGNRVVLIKRVPDESVIQAIKGRIKAFWDSVEAGREPSPDFARDSEFISRLYNYAEPGRVFNADDKISKLAFEYKRAADEEKAATLKKDAARAEIFTLVGDAEKVLGEMFTISAGLIGPKQIPAHERAGYRNFRITWKKEKS